MTADLNNNGTAPDPDDELKRVMRESVLRMQDDSTWPPREVLEAYLDGRATTEQEAQVHLAIAYNPKVREYLRATLSAMESLTDSQTQSAFDEVFVPPMPLVKQSVAKLEHQNWLNRLAGQLREWWQVPMLRPALVAAATIVVCLPAYSVFLRLSGSGLVALQPVAEVDPAFLSSGESRGDVMSRDSDQTVAFYRFKERIRQNDNTGQFELVETAPSGPEEWADSAVITLVSEGGRAATNIVQALPTKLLQESHEKSTVWILFSPSLRVWSAELSNQEMKIKWLPEMGTNGCLLITYPTDSGYVATAGSIFTTPQ